MCKALAGCAPRQLWQTSGRVCGAASPWRLVPASCGISISAAKRSLKVFIGREAGPVRLHECAVRGAVCTAKGCTTICSGLALQRYPVQLWRDRTCWQAVPEIDRRVDTQRAVQGECPWANDYAGAYVGDGGQRIRRPIVAWGEPPWSPLVVGWNIWPRAEYDLRESEHWGNRHTCWRTPRPLDPREPWAPQY